MRSGARLLLGILTVATLGWSCDSPLSGVKRLPDSAIRYVPIGPYDPSRESLNDVVAGLSRDGRLGVGWTFFDEATAASNHWYADEEASVRTLVHPVGVLSQMATTDGFTHWFFLHHGIDHLTRRSGTNMWLEADSIGRATDAIECFDAIGFGATVDLAYLAYPRDPVYGMAPDQSRKLVVVNCPEGSSPTFSDVATFQDAKLWSAGPRLAHWKNETHLVCAIADSTRAKLLHTYRVDGNEEWAPFTDLVPGGVDTRGIALAATNDRLLLFFEKDGLNVMESVDGRIWSEPIRLTKDRLAGNMNRSGRNLVASANADGVVIAWIDAEASHPMKKRDVLAIASSPASVSNLARSPVIRVTPSSREIVAIAATSQPGAHQIVWAGRSPLGAAEVAVARIETRR